MKEQINPICDHFCGTRWRIAASTNRANQIEAEAIRSGFSVEEGYVSCDGPTIGQGVTPGDGTVVFACRAICKTSEVEWAEEKLSNSVVTRQIDDQLTQAMAETFNMTDR